MKALFYFSVAMLLAIVLLWAGSRFMFFTADTIGSTELFLIGLGLVLGGIFMVGSSVGARWQLLVSLIVIGFYFLARAAGIIEQPWLARIIGFMCWLLALTTVYLTWPKRTRGLKLGG